MSHKISSCQSSRQVFQALSGILIKQTYLQLLNSATLRYGTTTKEKTISSGASKTTLIPSTIQDGQKATIKHGVA